MSTPYVDDRSVFSRGGLPEKRVRTLPAIRISETLENALMRLAAHDDRTLSGYVVRVLEKHVFGHALSLDADTASGNEGDAMQRSATGYGELSDR
jgi:hypothetical protein